MSNETLHQQPEETDAVDADAVAIRSGDSPALLPDEIESTIVQWRPRGLDDDKTALLPIVLPFVLNCVAAAVPTTVEVARHMMWAITRMTLWWYGKFSTLDATAMLTFHNVEHFSMFVNAHRSRAWRHEIRTVLRRVGRHVNPGGWPLIAPVVGNRAVSPPYPIEDEAMFARASLLPGRLNRAGRIWVVVASFAAGMTGREASAARVCDLTERDDGRVVVSVRGPQPRMVPIRAGYTDMAREAVAASDGTSFFRGKADTAAAKIAARLPDNPRATGDGEALSLRRARSTWLAAHLAANTPLAALRVIAGSVSTRTLDTLMEYVRAGIDPEDALELGMGA